MCDDETEVREVVRRAERSSGSAVASVVECVAAARDVSVTDLPPLGQAVDPDAIDLLFAERTRPECTVSFEFAGTMVDITGRGDVRVSPLGDGGSD
ncbi:HalOD1 output domain-containing protein [Haloarcula onubensis]|uniref:Halobacterial output domain-containing protein n=1 Tax=Haloarcula onubensis TaxID=2950539 RepID=A0ABU2FNB4_9EURY|nr:HalOD1 output domain-containing protein [Halomicroarcula sp. S3CR25-11]MDS0282245.1 hypothetical protein [Halomicroarcula sp. S3CR25-11]